jgi:hypothetical protein
MCYRVGRKGKIEQTQGLAAQDSNPDGEQTCKGHLERNLRKRNLRQAKEYEQSLAELSTPLADMIDMETVKAIVGHNGKTIKGQNVKTLYFRVEMIDGNIIKNVSLDDLKVDAPVSFIAAHTKVCSAIK